MSRRKKFKAGDLLLFDDVTGMGQSVIALLVRYNLLCVCLGYATNQGNGHPNNNDPLVTILLPDSKVGLYRQSRFKRTLRVEVALG